MRVAPRWVATVGVVAAMLATSAGACRRDAGQPAPAPAELGAVTLPASADAGVEATYARLTRTDRPADGGPPIECYHFVRLTRAGSASFGSGCTDSGDGPAALLADPAIWPGDTERGDYAHADGRLWLRSVAWDPLADEFVLTEYTGSYCGDSLLLGGEPGLGDPTYRRVAGAAPAGAPACP